MAVCTFFGHRDVPNDVDKKLISVLTKLIEQNGVNVFYVGNEGAFDKMVRRVLNDLSKKYPNIRYSVVLAYRPANNRKYDDLSDTVYPEELATCHKKFAINKRNELLIKKSDMVVCYVKYSTGGANFYTKLALQNGKEIINLAE